MLEEKVIELNNQCEKKLTEFVLDSNPELIPAQNSSHIDINVSSMSFNNVRGNIDMTLLNQYEKRITNAELKAFVKMHTSRSIRRGTISFTDVPSNKAPLLKRCFDLKDAEYATQLIPVELVFPVLLEPEQYVASCYDV